MNLKRSCLIGAALALLVSSGCGGEVGEPTYPVTGVVTWKGAPVEGAVVSFTSSGGKSAVGKTDASGRYSLTTTKSGDGAAAGHYQVTIAKYDNPPKPEAEAAADGAASGPSNVDVTAPDFNEYPEDYDELAASEIAAITAENILPERYANGSTSGLEVDVVAEGENVHNFDLEG